MMTQNVADVFAARSEQVGVKRIYGIGSGGLKSLTGVLGSRERISPQPIGRFRPTVAPLRAAQWEHGRGQLLVLAGDGPCEMEFRLPVHLALMLPDGSSAGWEWDNGERLGSTRFLAAGAMLFNPADNYLRIRKNGRGRCRVLLIAINPRSVEHLDGTVADRSQIEFRQEINFHDEPVRRTLTTLQEEIEYPSPHSTSCCNVLSLLLLTQLIGVASNVAHPRHRAYAKGGLPSWRLNRALAKLSEDLSAAPRLAELASDVGLHPSSFCRAFKQSTGLSPGRYLNQLRVARAKEMMVDRSLSLTRIALDCGFSCSNRFSVAFRRVTGVTPRTYRKSL
jgi:AraC-like DNA-binding protein